MVSWYWYLSLWNPNPNLKKKNVLSPLSLSSWKCRAMIITCIADDLLAFDLVNNEAWGYSRVNNRVNNRLTRWLVDQLDPTWKAKPSPELWTSISWAAGAARYAKCERRESPSQDVPNQIPRHSPPALRQRPPLAKAWRYIKIIKTLTNIESKIIKINSNQLKYLNWTTFAESAPMVAAMKVQSTPTMSTSSRNQRFLKALAKSIKILHIKVGWLLFARQFITLWNHQASSSAKQSDGENARVPPWGSSRLWKTCRQYP